MKSKIVIGLAFVAGSIALVGCSGGESNAQDNKVYEPQVATGLDVTPEEQAEALRKLNDPEVESATVQQLIDEGNGLLDEIHALARYDDFATTCAKLPELEQKIWDLDFVVGSLEGIDLSAWTDGVVDMRSGADEMMASYKIAASRCREMGR